MTYKVIAKKASGGEIKNHPFNIISYRTTLYLSHHIMAYGRHKTIEKEGREVARRKKTSYTSQLTIHRSLPYFNFYKTNTFFALVKQKGKISNQLTPFR